MVKNIIFNKKLIIVTTIVLVFIFSGISDNKVNAEGWKYVDNSWRYYSGPSIQSGWCSDNGAWYYLDEYGMKKAGWNKIEGKWYYLDPYTGKMLTGWVQDGVNWYYFNSSGEMMTGWLEYNGNLYYLDTSGRMVKDIYIGSYYLGPDGAWREGRIHRR